MFTDGDVPFGETIWVAIQVVGPTEVPTYTPAATETSIPPDATATPEPTATEHPAADLIGPTWVLKEYTPPDGSATTPLDDPDSTVNFEVNETVNGSGACNTYNGTFVSDGTNLDIEIGSTTQLLCDQPIMDQEQIFFLLLDEAQEYSVTADGSKLEMLAERTINDQQEDVIIMAFHAE
jgi:heat shock protein HslJ